MQLLEFLKVLKREGFFRVDDPYVLSFEVRPWKDEDSEIVIANAKRTLNRAWAPKESRKRLMELAADNLESFLAGNAINVVNQ